MISGRTRIRIENNKEHLVQVSEKFSIMKDNKNITTATRTYANVLKNNVILIPQRRAQQ